MHGPLLFVLVGEVLVRAERRVFCRTRGKGTDAAGRGVVDLIVDGDEVVVVVDEVDEGAVSTGTRKMRGSASVSRFSMSAIDLFQLSR